MCNAVEAILSAALAWSLYPWLCMHAPRLSGFALIAALVGALIAAIGSALIILDFTGWYLAGLYTMFGYALAGVWLFGLNAAALRSFSWPRPGPIRAARGCLHGRRLPGRSWNTWRRG